MKKNELDRPLWIASHFGFNPIDAPSITVEDEKIAKDCEEKVDRSSGKLICNAPEKAAFLRHYTKSGLSSSPHPLAISWRRGRDYNLELVGYPIGIAEAKLIRTALSIIAEEGYKNLTVEINSVGDKDSISAYERELRAYINKFGDEISTDLKRMFKEDPFIIAKMTTEEAQKLRSEMPPSVNHLSSHSRAHFKEVIEHLEALGVDYRFAPELLGHKNLCSEALFAVRGEDDKLLCAGYRYSRLSKRFGFKKELSLVGATVYGERKVKETKVYKEAPKPKFHLIHLGREARMKSLPLIETLRTSRIPVSHYLGHDKLGAQMDSKEAKSLPYHLIVGQKEALDNTVTVRNVASRAQDTVSISVITEYLKNLPF